MFWWIPDLRVSKTDYSVGICYLAEKVKNGVYEKYYNDLIVLKKNSTVIATSKTRIHITVGRIDDLVFEMATNHYVAITYTAGEFCNGIVIFDTRSKKAVMQRGCLDDSSECHVIKINESKCYAKIECREKDAGTESLTKRKTIKQTINLCK